MRGEAYFEVAKMQDKPFIVKVDQMSVNVLGTKFNISTRVENVVQTVLVEGKVRLESKGRQVVLKPSQKADFDSESEDWTVENVDVSSYVAWKDGNFVFDNKSLEYIMNRLSLWYDVEVQYSDEGVKGVKLSGDMKRYKNIQELLYFFERISDVRFVIKGKKITDRLQIEKMKIVAHLHLSKSNNEQVHLKASLFNCSIINCKFMKCKWILALLGLKKSKIFKSMKLFSVFMFVFVLGTTGSSFSQQQVVSLDMYQCDVGTLFREIRKQTGLRFVYNEEHVVKMKRFDVVAKSKTVKEILDDIFSGTTLKWYCEDDVIFIVRQAPVKETRDSTFLVKGTVKDINGEPLPGVTILIQGTTIGGDGCEMGNLLLTCRG